MAEKSISKVTVRELIEECDLNRKTFYYHFEDIYALLQWMLEQEAFEVVQKFDLLLNLEDAIQFVMNYVAENKHILNCALDSMGREDLKRFFCC
uniref:TetR family transcriptional regulator n=1 Tax=Clostridium sp. NkU-1 TaxID=1095009 RepID=UPI0006CF6E77